MIEIERKFLTNSSDFKKLAKNQYIIKQGYLNSDAERTVRVRVKNDKGYLTIKGKSNLSGTSRFEWEKEIPLSDALALLALCEDYIIEKTRYLIDYKNHTFEVDIFQGANEGLILAEIELETEEEAFEKPNWLGKEVTGELQYYNSYIAKNPFSNW